MTAQSDPLRVALYAGLFVQRDAVSSSLGAKLDILRRLVDLGAPIDITVFTQGSDIADPAIRVAASVTDMLADDRFWAADVHIFETGMYYDLCNAEFLIPADRPILAIDHNTTPPELVDDPVARAGCERALIQRYNLNLVRHVACVSEFNLEIARAVGVSDQRLSVLHLPPHIVPGAPPAAIAARRGPTRLLYVGRFVRAKGIADMLSLVERLGADAGPAVSVTLAGDPRFSDPVLLGAVQEAAARAPSGTLEVVLAPDDSAMAGLFEAADALVIPSYHEGYCVPVVEAYGFGRFVIAYDAGNLPNVVGQLGALVPTGDVHALQAAVVTFADRVRTAHSGGQLVLPTVSGDLPVDRWLDAVHVHLDDYSPENFERRFVGLLDELARQSPRGSPAGLQAAISARLGELVGAA
jgi:glycosyltransferase involved in cell wall biosynthesis